MSSACKLCNCTGFLPNQWRRTLCQKCYHGYSAHGSGAVKRAREGHLNHAHPSTIRMNLSLPPTPLEEAYKSNLVTNEKPNPVILANAELLQEWYAVNGRYIALKSKKAAGDESWSEELEAEFKTVEAKRTKLFEAARDKGLISHVNVTSSATEAYAQELRTAEEKKLRCNKLHEMIQRSFEIKCQIDNGTATPEMIAERSAIEKELEEPRKQAREALQAIGLIGKDSSSTVSAPAVAAGGS